MSAISTQNNQYQNNSPLDQSFSLQFETLLNNPGEWHNNPTESTRQCFSFMYNLFKLQQNTINQIERTKATKSEWSSSMNIKANIADIMRTFSEVAANIDSRPTMDDVQLLLDEKISRNELTDILASKPSMEEIKNSVSNGEIKINLKYSLDELNRNFVNKNEFLEGLNTKANKENVITALHKKANKNDVDSIIKAESNLLIEWVNTKVSNDEFNAYKLQEESNNPNQKIELINQDIDKLIENIRKQFQNVNSSLNNWTTSKADFKDVEPLLITAAATAVKKPINEDKVIDLLSKAKQEIYLKFDDFTKNYKKDLVNIQNKFDLSYNDIIETINIKTNKQDLQKQISEINHSISQFEQFPTFNDWDSWYKNCHKIVTEKFEEVQWYTQDYIKNFDNDLQEILDKKANMAEMISLLKGKSDWNAVNVALDNKVSRTEYETMKLSFEKINQDYHNKIDFMKFDEFVNSATSSLEEIQKDLMEKANIKEMMKYLKNKADIDEVNKAWTLIHDELDLKTTINDFNNVLDNQSTVIDALCKENSVGKWKWESGKVKSGYAVPWEIQTINTCPESIVWEKDNTSILVMEKGIYMLALAFFVRDKPTVQILVNGKVILTAWNSNAFMLRHEENEVNNIDFFNNDDIDDNDAFGNTAFATGWTMTEYINLNERSRVTISYSGCENVKAFMQLKKI